MKINKFDVVELKNKDRATILDISNNKYLSEIVNQMGERKDIKEITEREIGKVIYQKIKYK